MEIHQRHIHAKAVPSRSERRGILHQHQVVLDT